MKRLILTAIIAAFMTAGASADVYAPGVGQDFSWENAEDTAGLFGQPLGFPDANEMYFPFSTFNAFSSGGDTVTVTDTFQADLIANEGLRFTQITFLTQGDYNITGTPGQNSVEAEGTLTVDSIAGDAFAGSNNYVFFDEQPTDGSIFWEADTLVAIPWELPDDLVVTSVHISAQQDVIAISTDGTADITAFFEIVGIAVVLIPEPASLALLALGGLALVRRR
jgi:hypothetical protein